MFFDRLTTFATQCEIDDQHKPMSFAQFEKRAVRIHPILKEWPETLRRAFIEIPPFSDSPREYDMAIESAIRQVETRIAYISELARRNNRGANARGSMSAPIMERRENGD